MKPRLILTVSLTLALGTGLAAQSAEEWAPVKGRIMTRWAKEVGPKNALPEYPRPQMVRKDWMNLNGLWSFAISGKEDPQPTQLDRKILVPYPVESALSGIGHIVQPTERLWYKRTVNIPSSWKGKRVILHFGAVDWDSTVYVNGKEVGKHTGGYDPFSFDITDALKSSGNQEIVVSVWDPTDIGQPHGKQVLRPGGIMYTATSGIWQTVWLEPVSRVHIASYKLVPDVDRKVITIKVNADSASPAASALVEAIDNGKTIISKSGKPGQDIVVPIVNPKLWSPDKPFLYDLRITLTDQGQPTDTVTGYFGMRKISIKKDENGVNRLALNNQILFQYGPLDQGFWPDGLYTPPTDAALRYDIDIMKQLGCNMMRKHVKVEPARLYYWADKLGLLVWQDMPAGSNPPAMRDNFESELIRMIDYLHNHPSVIMWVVFNEAWGQYDTPRLTEMVKKYDPSRLVSNASGWTDMKCGDVIDMHNYPGPGMPQIESKRVAVLGEFGGLGHPIKNHLWKEEGSWGYVSYKDAGESTDAYVSLLNRMLPLIGKGLAAAVYTQTSDVEIEVNGLMTYDREIIKFDPKRSAEAAARLYEPQAAPKVIVPCAEQGVKINWRYTTTQPSENWFSMDFDDTAWAEAPAAFGNMARSATKWDTPSIWIRRDFHLDSVPARPHLNIFHDEDAEVYINGKLAARLTGYNTSYESVPLSPEAAKLLKPGKNTFAIYCKQTSGGQAIDCGIVEPVDQK